MSQNFKIAHNGFAARWEGGLVDDPADTGGITNYGVSLRFAKANGLDVNKDGVIDRRDIIDLLPEAAAGILKRFFWDALRLDEIPRRPAVVLYDGAINQGCKTAVCQMQTACNILHGGYLRIDGAMGPVTRQRVADICAKGQAAALAQAALRQRSARYRRLVQQRPANEKFLKGWLNRVDALEHYVAGLS